MKLVIAEKPSVGAAIAAVMGANEKRSGYFEGGGYLVSWCIGHLISLADAATYNEQFRKWKYDDLPIVPQEWQFIVASGKEQQFSILKDLMHRSDVTEIINACDSGREGELIFRFVYEQANCKKPFSRLWIILAYIFNSIGFIRVINKISVGFKPVGVIVFAVYDNLVYLIL